MARYRFRIPAHLYFNVDAESREDARAKAGELVDRISDGTAVRSIDSEDERHEAYVFADDSDGPEALSYVLGASESEYRQLRARAVLRAVQLDLEPANEPMLPATPREEG